MMKSHLIIVVVSTLVGLVLGTAVAYRDFELLENTDQLPVNISVSETESGPSPPQAVVPETTFAFGNIEHRATMQHDYSISNQGGSPLIVTYGSSTCNCTALEMEGKPAKPGDRIVVAPGESATVMLEWTAKSSAGPYRHGASFITNDPEMSQIELNVEGKVVESTAIHPSELLFGSLNSGDSKEAYFHLLAYLNQPVEVIKYKVVDEELAKQVEVRVEQLSADELPDPNASGGVKVIATYQSGKALGPFSGVLRLETNLEKAKMLSIPLLGRVVGDISVYGPGWIPKRGVLRMGKVKSEQGKKVRLNLVVRGPHAKETRFEVSHIDPPELKASLDKPREMGAQLLHQPLFVEIPAGTRTMARLGEPASTDAEVVLSTTHPESSEVRLRVHFTVGP